MLTIDEGHEELKQGDKVRVWPCDQSGQKAEATVVLISANQKSIAVAFADKPPFAFTENMPLLGVHPDLGIVLLASRHEDGRWRELAAGNWYQIEAA